MSAKCPHCEKILTRIRVTDVEAGTGPGGNIYRAILFYCPGCGAPVGAQIDPLVLNSDLVRKLKR